MRPVEIPGATRVLAKGQPEYEPLHVRDEVVELVTAMGKRNVNAMRTRWKPSVDQLAVLNVNGYIDLVILGRDHPPVHFDVGLDLLDGLPDAKG